MDQLKIGKFIAESRKKQNLTQAQLAEKLGITDRAVSKWETGKTMPDSSLMLELCDLLDISVNDLLNGEVISSESYNKKLEERLLEIAVEKERSDKMLMWFRTMAYVVMIIFTYIIAFIEDIIHIDWLMTTIYLSAMALLLFSVVVKTKVLQQAGYYRCENCGYTYTPSFRQALIAALTSSKKPRLRCNKCNKSAKHAKVYSKE